MFTSLYRASGAFIGYASRAEFYDFNFQQTAFEANPYVLYPGDRLVTHCVYDSVGMNTTTTFGISTANEMCTTMLFYYPQIEELSFCGFSRLNKSAPSNITYCGLRQASDVMQISNPVTPDPISTIQPLFGLPPVGPCLADPSPTTGAAQSPTSGIVSNAVSVYVSFSFLTFAITLFAFLGIY